MSESTTGSKNAANSPVLARRRVHAARVSKPEACGCGAPIAFDVERKAFFCVGCGAFRSCTCRRSALTSQVRPVNVA